MPESVLCYEPAPRWAHVAAAVEGKLYIWGGKRRDFPAVHDGPAKTAVTSVVDILDPQVIFCYNQCFLVWLWEIGGQDLLWRVMISTRSVVSDVASQQPGRPRTGMVQTVCACA